MQDTMSDLKKWLLLLALTAVCVVISYEFLDRPIAFYLHEHVRHYRIFARATQLPELIVPLGAFVLLWLGIRALMQRPLSAFQAASLLCVVSLVITEAAKRELKIAFGRAWPETWMRNNPSLMRDGVYGFTPFQGGQAFASFPSGHTAAICSVMAGFWVAFSPRRGAFAVLVFRFAGGLGGGRFHFLRDVISR